MADIRFGPCVEKKYISLKITVILKKCTFSQFWKRFWKTVKKLHYTISDIQQPVTVRVRLIILFEKNHGQFMEHDKQKRMDDRPNPSDGYYRRLEGFVGGF